MGVRRSPQVTYDVLDGRAVLVHPEVVQMLTLNQVGTLVWQQLDGEMGPHELTAALLPLLKGVSAEQLEADIANFLAGLARDRLVVESNDED